jgi:hypothetical protein
MAHCTRHIRVVESSRQEIKQGKRDDNVFNMKTRKKRANAMPGEVESPGKESQRLLFNADRVGRQHNVKNDRLEGFAIAKTRGDAFGDDKTTHTAQQRTAGRG